MPEASGIDCNFSIFEALVDYLKVEGKHKARL
jgi:hypothetical protein